MIPENKLPEEENYNDTNNFEHVTDDIPAFLCSVNNHTEADMVEALLKSNYIPVWRKLRSGGDIAMVYMAVYFSGADLYVPSKLLEKAKMLLSDDRIFDEADDINETKDIEESDDISELLAQVAKERRARAWSLLALFIILLVPLLFALAAIVLER